MSQVKGAGPAKLAFVCLADLSEHVSLWTNSLTLILCECDIPRGPAGAGMRSQEKFVEKEQKADSQTGVREEENCGWMGETG